MKTKNDGDFAFPGGAQFGNGAPFNDGMTLRDWIAATIDNASLPIINSFGDVERFVGEPVPEDTIELLKWACRGGAKLRYMFADAMIAERDK